MVDPFLKLTDPEGDPVFIHVDDVESKYANIVTNRDADDKPIGEPFKATVVGMNSGACLAVMESVADVHRQWLSVASAIKAERNAEYVAMERSIAEERSEFDTTD